MAKKSEFGSVDPTKPQTGKHTLTEIIELCKKVDPWDLAAFQKAAKLRKLLGDHLPFWRNWRFAKLSLFLTGEILHMLHKFFFNHGVLTWCKELTGPHALATRFKCLHQQVGVRHFSSGISHIKQMIGRDHHNIERTIISLLVGLVPDPFISAIRAIVEFIYLAQDSIHTDLSIMSMEQALRNFHTQKDIILQLEACKAQTGPMDHFKIRKLELCRRNGEVTDYAL